MNHKTPETIPVITHFFAAKEVRPGETWRVYLRAEDPGQAMNRIVCVLEEPGAGTHPVSFIKIREIRRREMSGYIFLNTGTAHGVPFASCRLTIQIQDKEGHYSNAVSFPLNLNPRASQENPPPGTFEDQDLGPILIPFPSTPRP